MDSTDPQPQQASASSRPTSRRASGRGGTLASLLAGGLALVLLVAAACAEEEEDLVPEDPVAEEPGEEVIDADEDARVERILAMTPNTPAGESVYVEDTQPACADCHALAAAGVDEGTASDLDELQPDARVTIESIVTGEIGAHSAQGYETQMTDQQIADVAAYIEVEAGS